MNSGTVKCLHRYAKMLDNMNIRSQKDDTNPTSLEHILWMIMFMLLQHPMSVDKYSRWLGFIQACLVWHGITTVKEERDVTRPWFKNM